jgi:ribosomal protein S18 acetylase RimI-like enzyme
VSGLPDALSAVRRTNQVFHELLSERVTLSCGVAFVCPRYAALPGANQLREMIIPPGRSMASIFEEVQAFFTSRGLVCRRWVPAADQPVEPVEAFLAERGFEPHRRTVMALQEHVDLATNPDVRVLPARAMRAAVRELMANDDYFVPEVRELAAEAVLDRLDDPRYEMEIAMLQGRPAGHAALLEAGDIGAIYSMVVLEPFRRQGVGRTLMKHLLSLSRRLALRATVLEVDGDDPVASALYEQCGFKSAGHYTEFLHP